MNDYSGFIVIGRYNPHEDWTPSSSLMRNTKPQLSLGDYLSRFKGIEGDMWLCSQDVTPPTENGAMLSPDDFEKAEKFYNEFCEIVKCDLIYEHDSVNPSLPDVVKEKFFLCGYELGMYNELNSYWSSITNEVINGTLPEMMDFVKCLNQHFLLPDINIAKKLSEVRQKLCNAGHRGKALEDIEGMTYGEPCHILEIHCLKKV